MASSTKIMRRAIANPRVQRTQGLELLLLFTSKRVCQVRVHGGQVRENRIDQDAVGFATRNHRGVHVRRDRDDALAIPPPNGRWRYTRVQRGHTGNRDLGPRSAYGSDILRHR